MPLDIVATQRLYGASTNGVLAGGQVFGFNCNVAGAAEPVFRLHAKAQSGDHALRHRDR